LEKKYDAPAAFLSLFVVWFLYTERVIGYRVYEGFIYRGGGEGGIWVILVGVVGVVGVVYLVGGGL
jgi:hypothetical protein